MPTCAAISPSEPVPPARVHGAAAIAFARDGAGRTRLTHLDQRVPMRVLFPAPQEAAVPIAALVTTSGGLVGGDYVDVEVDAGAGASALVTPQAAEKVYRSTGADCRVRVTLSAGDRAWLEWLPQEAILFDGARLDRKTVIRANGQARVLAGEMLVFGRIARGERYTHGRVRDEWEIHRDGQLTWLDCFGLDEDIPGALASPAGLGGARATASLISIGPNPNDGLDFVRTWLDAEIGAAYRAAVTVVNGVLVVRWLGSEPDALRQSYGRLWAALRHHLGGFAPALPRLWWV